MVNIGKAMGHLAIGYPELLIVWPAHKNPKARPSISSQFRGPNNVVSIEPVEYGEFSRLIANADIVLTTSGDIQEEAPSLGNPVLVLRENTERLAAADAGTSKLIGTDVQRIVAEATRLLDDRRVHREMANAVNPYGDGHSADRSVAIPNELLTDR